MDLRSLHEKVCDILGTTDVTIRSTRYRSLNYAKVELPNGSYVALNPVFARMTTQETVPILRDLLERAETELHAIPPTTHA